MIRDANERMKSRLAAYRLIDGYDSHLTVRAIKHTLDGALGSRGAWLLEPYSDLPGSTGLNTTPLADRRGDRASSRWSTGTSSACTRSATVRTARPSTSSSGPSRPTPRRKDVRWRIEHAQHLGPADIPRFAALGVIASMQGIHCTSDAAFVPARLGARRVRGGRLRLAEAHEVGGHGARTEPTLRSRTSIPIANFHATVTRRLKDGSVFYPDQRMTRPEALRSYTLNAAYAAFEETSKGSLKVGKLADVTVLSHDILTIPEEEITTARADYTIVGGRVLHERK